MTATNYISKNPTEWPSPFREGTDIQFAWDSTSLGTFKECPRKYQLSILEAWRGRGESVHLTFGIHYHHALEQYDRELAFGSSYEQAVRDTVRDTLLRTWERPTCEYCLGAGVFDGADDQGSVSTCEVCHGAGFEGGKPWDSGHHLKTRENLVRSVIWYLEQFGENDPARTVVLDSGKPAVELSFRLQVDDDLVLCGHLDRVVEFQGQNYVMDRKTSTSTISSYYFDQYSPDNQMSLYTLAGGIIYKNPVRGVIIDAVQIAVGFSRFERGMVYRTEHQSQEWLNDTKVWVAQAQWMAERNHWPMNDKSCHKYGGCPFREICSSDARVRTNFLESKFTRHPWNPLESR